MSSTHLVELGEEERSRLRPSVITLLYVMGDMLRQARRQVGQACRNAA